MKMLTQIYTYSALVAVFLSIIFFPFIESYDTSTLMFLSIVTGGAFITLFVSGITHYFVSGDARRKHQDAVDKWKNVSIGQFLKVELFDLLPMVLIFSVALLFSEGKERIIGGFVIIMIVIISLLPDFIGWLKSRKTY